MLTAAVQRPEQATKPEHKPGQPPIRPEVPPELIYPKQRGATPLQREQSGLQHHRGLTQVPIPDRMHKLQQEELLIQIITANQSDVR